MPVPTETTVRWDGLRGASGRTTAAVLILAACLRPACAAQQRVSVPDRFDGNWSVEIITEAGTCDRAYRYPVQIERGQARFPGTAFVVNGRVASNGAVSGSISGGSATARIVGRLATNGFGSGTWTGSGSLDCRGRWNAERRG